MKRILFYSALFLMLLSACQSTKTASSKSGSVQVDRLNKEAAVLWQQTSAEYDALCYQAFNLAKYRIDEMKERQPKRKMFIIMDLDETVLDNSPYNGYLVKNNKEFEKESWDRWVRLAKAELVPGALDFIRYAESKGIKIYYISNRSVENINYTFQNLTQKGINVSQEQLILDNGSSKDQRRQLISSESEAVMLIGDNLADFLGMFEEEMGYVDRKNEGQRFQVQYGDYFIVLPNPMYGGWEKALKYNDPMIEEGEDAKMSRFLKSFE